MIKVVFFAALKEQLGCAELTLPLSEQLNDLSTLKQTLANKGENWQKALANPLLMVAINQEIVHHNQPLTANDEVAFFPPVTGG